MEKLYFVAKYGVGITYFNNSDNDSMTSIRSSENKGEWKRFTLEEATEIHRHTGYDIFHIDDIYGQVLIL